MKKNKLVAYDKKSQTVSIGKPLGSIAAIASTVCIMTWPFLFIGYKRLKKKIKE